jgi:CubicO group peptidase (beta-lactamase class C family)
VSPHQERIQALLDRLVAEGRELGLQVVAYLGGRLVVDAWAGVAERGTDRPVDGETLFPVFSATKGIAATIVHRLVERGALIYDRPIAEVWPEFGARGKDRITLRQALNHSAGVPQMPVGIGYAELCDWRAMCSLIAGLSPLWPPGTRIEYHAMTYGWILGEVAQRADGRAFEELLQDEVRRPLGLEDALFVGIPDRAEPRVAVLEEHGVEPLPDDGKPQSVPALVWPLHTMMNRPDARRACIPASNGIMNARAIARHYAALLPGGVDGVELLPSRRVDLATEPQRPERPEGNDWPKDKGLGYSIGGDGSASFFGHGGYGGSIGRAYPKLGLAVGLTKNLFHKEDTPRMILDKLLDSLRTEQGSRSSR